MIVYTVTQIWLFLALLFIMFEIGTPGLFFSLSFAFGALSASVGAWNNLTILSQWGFFFGGAIVSLLILKALVAVDASGSEATNVHALIGKQGIVVKETIECNPAQIKVGGECWLALTEDGQPLQNKKIVTIINVTGTKLIVKINK